MANLFTKGSFVKETPVEHSEVIVETNNRHDDFVQVPTVNRPTSLRNITRCIKCTEKLKPALAMNGSESQFWKECPKCGALFDTWIPLPHQRLFLSDPHKYKMGAGGYGTGKTTEDIKDVEKHLMLIPRSRVCIAARTYPALESTFCKDFFADFPEKLIVKKNEQKHEFRLSNGSEFMFKSFDDPTKLKSLNLTKIVIVEASDVPYEGFTMMQTRLRNTAALIPYYNPDGSPVTYFDEETQEEKIKYRVDARGIDLETNPASNWVKSKFLQDASVVRYLGSAKDENYKMNKNPDKNKYVQVVSTDANPHLPETYIEELCHGKSPAWIAQFIRGSFNFNDNLVFPNIGLCIRAPRKLPREFDDTGKRVLYYCIGLDYGISDYTHIIYGALSLEENRLIIYDELRLNNSDVPTICKEYRKETKINGTNLNALLMTPLFDGRSYSKRESDLHTIGGAFEAQGLYFDPSFTSHEVRIVKTNALINHDQLEIFSTCEFVIEELLNYSYKLDKNGISTGKPMDGHDHGITAMEFIIAELPHNLKEINIRSYLPEGTRIEHDKKPAEPERKEKVFNPLEVKQDYGSFGYNNRSSSGNFYSPISCSPFGILEEDEVSTRQELGAYGIPRGKR